MLSLNVPTQFRGYILDDFQREAIHYLLEGASVFVAAPTGAGKTLIADFVVEMARRWGRGVIYTAPIKALSNQKYKQFREIFGEESVGLVTGDVVRNETAPVVLMTTEIFRNILFDKSRPLDDIAFVIFDEIHYIADEARGFVWEESLIFLPSHVRFLGLSATIANAGELAGWMTALRDEPVRVVEYTHRPVPLSHHYFTAELGITDLPSLENFYKKRLREWQTFPWKDEPFQHPDHRDLIDILGDAFLPVLFFVFSRRGCEEHAFELALSHNYLRADEVEAVEEAMDRYLWGQQLQRLHSVQRLREILRRGIGFHHAGLLPACKELVEELFERRLIKVLYATETFAVGVNFPVRTVCFDSYTKYDGREFRPLTVGEYYQMAGRAGRRGIDEQGFVYSMVDLNFYTPGELNKRQEEKVEPLRSQFDLSYNSVLNLTARYDTPDQIRSVLARNFLIYQNLCQYRAYRAQLLRASDTVARLAQQRCPHYQQETCILAVRKVKRRIDKLQKKLRHLKGKGSSRKGQRRQQLLHRLRLLERKVASIQAYDCSRGEQKNCHRREREARRAEKEIKALKKKMRSLLTREQLYEMFVAKQRFLEYLGYIEEGELTGRGRTAAGLYVQELLVTELIFDGTLHDLTEDALNALAVCINYEPRRDEKYLPWRLVDLSHAEEVARRLARLEKQFLQEQRVRFHNALHELAYRWSRGCEFTELLQDVDGLAEGDIVTAFRRGIDLLRQIRRVCADDEILKAKLNRCMQKMDRDVVQVRL